MEGLMRFRFRFLIFAGILLYGNWGAKSLDIDEFYVENAASLSLFESKVSEQSPNALMVPLTLIQPYVGAVCLDGSLPGYHLDRGSGSGENSWLIFLQGGGWCNNIKSCVYRRNTSLGSSTYFEKEIPFTGILSSNAEHNPDFFNWNRVKIRYCDGASFTGDTENLSAGLQFRGQRIFDAVMEELISIGMNNSNQALLAGCSAGGLASIIHCDRFHELFPETTKVKCFSDAGFFMDVADISGGYTLWEFYEDLVNLHGSKRTLPSRCFIDATSCFFPENWFPSLQTPLFILNAAYDTWQILNNLAPSRADPDGTWADCKKNYNLCTPGQIEFLQDFRNKTLNALTPFRESTQNGLFMDSCFSHCQSERHDTWFSGTSPMIGNKTISRAVGDWYFDRSNNRQDVDCEYPCGSDTCHNLISAPAPAPSPLPVLAPISSQSLVIVPISSPTLDLAQSETPGTGMVPLILIQGHEEAVCLDGTVPGYHLDRGFGTGANSWLVNFEGGAWCNDVRTCIYRRNTSRGSSTYFEKAIQFTGILSNNASQNPDFYNWNRVKIRYCDGASFAGDSEDQAKGLQFRGQRIYEAAMEELMSNGMNSTDQALLAGCSAGGLASILHCDEFRTLFPESTKVKCLADSGLFMDVADVSGGHTLKNLFEGVVSLQGVRRNFSSNCLQDPTSCFLPQNLISNIKTPLFILSAAYDSWQILESLAHPRADPEGAWTVCRKNYTQCSPPQIHFLQDFRNQTLNALEGFRESTKNGLFMNSCFAHCQSENQDTWFADNSPLIGNKTIAVAVGDWYFERASSYMNVDCAYPCGNETCRNLVFR